MYSRTPRLRSQAYVISSRLRPYINKPLPPKLSSIQRKHMSDNTQEQFILARNEAMSDSPSHEEIQARKQEWEEKLKGKKFADEGALSTQEEGSCFTKRDLPERHRVVKPGQMVTMDWYPDRVNVHIGDDNVCTHVSMG